MQHIDAAQISHDLPARVSYLQSFLQFDPNVDGPLIAATKPVLAPLVNDVVDVVYDHLLKYDITAAAFAPAQTTGQSSYKPQELHGDHPNIKFRKHFLKAYLVKLVSTSDWSASSKLWDYLDKVGKAHTGSMDSGLKGRQNKPPLWVEYRDINLLLGWVENAVTDIVMGTELETKTKLDIVKALNKFWWIQNDLFARHYVVDRDVQAVGGQSSVNNIVTELQRPVPAALALLSTCLSISLCWMYW